MPYLLPTRRRAACLLLAAVDSGLAARRGKSISSHRISKEPDATQAPPSEAVARAKPSFLSFLKTVRVP